MVALLLSVLNAIMGVGRSLYQIAEDGTIPRFFGKLNRNGVPANAMLFNVVCSIAVLFFGSPLEIYIFSNMGYLLSCALAFVGYGIYRISRPELPRPVRMRYLAYSRPRCRNSVPGAVASWRISCVRLRSGTGYAGSCSGSA